MTDRISKKKRSWNMSRIKSRDTKPEILVRKYLFSKGYRYRLSYKIKGKPDIAFPSRKIAIFINGCFWHLHGCSDSSLPKSNKAFWRKKLMNNKKRDAKNKRDLEKKGWKCITVWECDLKKKRDKTLKKLEEKIKENPKK